MPPVIPTDARFSVDPDITPQSLAPEQRRALRENYEPDQGYGAFSSEISGERGPDRSVYLMGARWEGVTRMAYQEGDMREGYFVARRAKGPWRWVLWRCSWDDDACAWWWSSAGATTWRTKDRAVAGREMLRRLWATWRDHPAPVETDASGLLYPEDIDALVAEVFGGPQTDQGPLEAHQDAAPEHDATRQEGPPGPGPVTAEALEEPNDLSDPEMLASTSDADLARLLDIRYRNAASPGQPETLPPVPPTSPEDLPEDERGYGLGRSWRYPLRYRPAPEDPSPEGGPKK